MRKNLDHHPAIRIAKVGEFDIAYREKTSDVAVLRHSFESDIYLTGVPEYSPLPHHVILDVGAHIGTFSLLASSVAGRVYAIEPCFESFNLCQMNVRLNRLSNRITVSHLALSDQQGECTLHYSEGNWGHTIMRRLSGGGEQVQALTLSEFLRVNGVTHCDFMKMNCEGAEFPIILKSSCETLRQIRMLVVLYHCDLCSMANEHDLLAHLRTCGFEAAIRNRIDQRGWIVARQRRAR